MIEVKKSRIHEKGLGVFATKNIREGTLVCTWEQAVKIDTHAKFNALSEEEKRFLTVVSSNDKSTVSLKLVPKPARYINHSCDPNVSTANGGETALREIKAGEEITVDYDIEEGEPTTPCNCGSANCRGVFVGQLNLNEINLNDFLIS